MMRNKKISSFLKSRRGSIATAGGLSVGVAVAAVALSATVAHTYETRADVQRALDAALLSAARSDDFTEPQAIVEAYVRSYVRDAGISAKNMIVEASYDELEGVLRGNVKFRVDAIFPVPSSVKDHMRPRVEAQVTPPGAHRMEIALALDMSGSMSMDLAGNPGRAAPGQSRLDALRTALNGMFDQIEAQSTEHGSNIYVSIVPYAGSVNIGNLYKGVSPSRSIQNKTPQNGGPEPHNFFSNLGDNEQRLVRYYDLGNWTYENYCVSYNRWGSCTRWERYEFWSKADDQGADYLKRGVWATERVGANLAKDQAPDVVKNPFATFEDLRDIERVRRNNATAFDKSWATPALHVLPLTNNVAEMRAYADNLVAYGGTAGHLGMEWAWRSISPNWGGAWAFKPTDSAGRFASVTTVLPLTQVQGLLDGLLTGVGDLLGETVGGLLGILGLGGGGGGGGGGGANYVTADRLPTTYDARNASKAIVMMTDGVFSSAIDSVAANDATLRSASINSTVIEECLKAGNLQNLTGTLRSNAQAACKASFAYFEQICTAAKQQGVKVYTIAFTEGADGSLDSLRRCASDPGKIFAVNTGVQLNTAFTKIFHDTGELRVSR